MSVAVEQTPVLPVSPSRFTPLSRFIIGLLGFIIVLTLFAMANEVLKDPHLFPVSNVDVLGTLDYTDRNTLSKRVESEVGKGLLALNISDIRMSVESLPWVAAAHVRREWPGRLTIAIEEHEPAARWNSDGLVSKRHELFLPPQLHPESVQHMAWAA